MVEFGPDVLMPLVLEELSSCFLVLHKRDVVHPPMALWAGEGIHFIAHNRA